MIRNCGFELAQCIFFVRRSFQNTNLLAFEGRRAGVVQTLLHHHETGRVVVLVGEVDLFQAVFGDRHGADDDVVLLGHQTRDHAVPALLDKDTLAFDFLAQRVRDVDVKSRRFAISGLEGVGFIGRIDSDLEFLFLSKGCD